MQPTPSFTGRTRRRRTSRAVQVGDFLARGLITVGGIGTIVAVSTVCLFLFWVVLPLFIPGRIEADSESQRTGNMPRHMAIDEQQTLGWTLDDAGTLETFRLNRTASRPLGAAGVLEGEKLTATSFPTGSASIGLGFADGRVRLASVRFVSKTVDDRPQTNLAVDRAAPRLLGAAGVLEGEDLTATSFLHVEPSMELIPGGRSAIVRLDHLERGNSTLYAGLTADDQLWIASLVKRRDPRTQQDYITRRDAKLPISPDLLQKEQPSHVMLAGSGDNVYVLWPSGRLQRFDMRNLSKVQMVEELDVVDDTAARLTCATFLLGRGTLITGDSTGRVRAWFRAMPDEVETSRHRPVATSGQRLICGHDFSPTGSAITALAASTRTRLLAAGMEDGRVRLIQVTSERIVGEVRSDEEAITALALAPKDDGLIATTNAHLRRWRVDAPHAEVTLASLFLPVWYEGYSRPMHLWQSSAANQDFEPKLGLWPLVFGTIKATFYSMLFGAPLALLAALYTSEFLHPRVKAKIKPTIELMASLPSVVLGFLAALLFAPVIAKAVPAVLACLFTLPVAFLLGAYCWQLMPQPISLKLARWRFVFIALVLPVGLLGAWWLGPHLEQRLFGGDLMGWLDGQHGSALGGWLVLLFPLCGAGAIFVGRESNAWFRHLAANWSRGLCALVDLLRFFAGLLGSLLAALLFGWLLTSLGWDPRGMFIGTYDQRNALIVGFVMGFAIIPLIYTIAEDALAAVPQHLRSASLGAGATPWQTAVRIVIPTAMSGLFSALMIGLGRAVGETMIVLMAAGNTPVREWNIFNGFRTLSANIAVELPEAPVDSTHYRTLFLAALCLFGLTFLVNTVAEIVRLRFRRRAYEL